jgi:hypothetical protein
MAFSSFSAGILQKLGVISKEFMELMAETIRSKNAPKKIIEHTSADSPRKQGSKFSVEVKIDTSENAAPMAGAYEYGSGEHGEEGKRYKIPTIPGLLAIPRERYEAPYFPPERDPVILASVKHPGVEARPYIAPSIVKIIPRMKKIFAEEYKRQYLMGTPKVTVISAKK